MYLATTTSTQYSEALTQYHGQRLGLVVSMKDGWRRGDRHHDVRKMAGYYFFLGNVDENHRWVTYYGMR